MDYHGIDLNFVQSDIDLASVKPIELKQLIRSVNEYLLRMSDILNVFATKMENGVLKLDRRLDCLETQMILLEKKLENVSETTLASPSPHQPAKVQQDADTNPIATPSSATQTEVATNATENKAEIPEVQSGMTKVKDHEVYAKYFKMLRLGVPLPAVRQKMETEGLDSSLISNPDKLIHLSNKEAKESRKPDAEGSPEQSSSESNDSFSDSE